MAMTSQGPYCECAHCDATGRDTGVPVRLPYDAWLVAGEGPDCYGRIAVALGHELRFRTQGIPIERHKGWYAVGAYT